MLKWRAKLTAQRMERFRSQFGKPNFCAGQEWRHDVLSSFSRSCDRCYTGRRRRVSWKDCRSFQRGSGGMSDHTIAILFCIVFLGLARVEQDRGENFRSLTSVLLGVGCLAFAILSKLTEVPS